MKKTVVLYPGFLATHFTPMMQLADALLEQGYAVEVPLIDITMDHDAALAFAVERAASAKPSVVFHWLPRIEDPPAVTNDARMLVGYFATIRRYNDRLHEFLRSLLPRGSVHAVVVDGPSIEALDVTRELGVPAYTFFATNASAVAVFLQLPWIRRGGAEGQGQLSFRELGDAPLDLRGVATIPASHLMPEYLEDPESEVYRATMNVTRRNPEADGILVNTLASLEPRAVAALRDPRLLGHNRMPPVYCVRPLVVASSETKEGKHECLAWLDQQPERSVVFLSFGTLGAVCHTAEQLREIAAALERSGHRFLWVVRAPNGKDREGTFDPNAEPDLDALLPEGFTERTRGRGLVVKLWVPQMDVLHHRATAAFVTHCGWNSAVEAMEAGVPMIC
jgi:hypothetical protein